MSPSFQGAFDALKIRLAFIKNVAAVFRPSAARRRKIRHDRFAVIRRDNSPRLLHRHRPHLRLDRDAFIHLRIDGRDHIETLRPISPDIGYRVGPSRHRLRLLSLDRGQAELRRHYTQKIILKRDDVDHS